MGIYERDYIRRAPPGRGGALGAGGGGLGGMRMWSANTWLIIACVAVFVVNGFMSTTLVHVGDELLRNMHSVDMSLVVEGPRNEIAPDHFVHELRLTTGEYVGLRYYTAMEPFERYLHFSTARGFLQFELWRLVGFQFLHASGGHILFNMIGLFFFGPMVERYLGRKRYLAFYLLCGIFGALVYMLLNLGGYLVGLQLGSNVRVPGLLFNNPYTPLIGASAGVFGVLMAGAFLAPRATVLLFFFLPMQLRTLAYALVVLALINVLFSGSNAGGEAAHLGGAFAGFYFIRHPQHLHGFFDILGRVDPTSHHYRGASSQRPGGKRTGQKPRGASNREIDRLLDKVQKKGLPSLSEKERKTLNEASRRLR